MPTKPSELNTSSESSLQEAAYGKRLDTLNLQIVKDLVSNPDTRSIELSKNYHVPLSTIQRRRTRLERTLLKRKYELDYWRLNVRQADLFISVKNGDSEDVGRKLLVMFPGNVISSSVRIGDPQVNLMARIIYHTTGELLQLLDNVKSNSSVQNVSWSEIVLIVSDEDSNKQHSRRVVDRLLDQSSMQE